MTLRLLVQAYAGQQAPSTWLVAQTNILQSTPWVIASDFET